MKKFGWLSLLLALLLTCGTFVRSTRSQDKAPDKSSDKSQTKSQDKKKADDDIIKISAELVQVDVLVSDKDNKPVGGLKREDFELFDNDKPQQVGFFSFEESKLRQVEAEAETERALPRVMTPANLRRVIAFVVDTLHIGSDSLYRTRKLLAEFVNTRMEPGDLVLIVPTGGGSGIYQQFTADQRLLRLAVSQLRQPFILDNDSPARRSSTSNAVLSLLPRLAETDPHGNSQAGINTGDPVEDSDVRASLASLEGTIDAMKHFPGRKIGVFISEGLRTFRTSTTSELTETTYRAARANVVFYAIDPQGLATQNLTAGLDPLQPRATDANSPTGFAEQSVIARGADDSLGRKRDDFVESQDALFRLAQETGGKFYRNNNDIVRGLNSFLEENSSYYLLGFQPEGGRWDGKYHKLKVTVRNRPDLVVTTRKGYMAKADKPVTKPIADPKVAEFVEAFSSPLVRRDIDLRLTPFYRDDARRDSALTSLIHIDAAHLHFKQSGADYKDKLSMTGVLLDRAGKAADSFSNTIDLSYPPAEYAAVRRDGLLVTRGTAVKPGVYQMRVLVREAESGIIGTAMSFVEIPNLKEDRLASSSLFTDAQLMQDKRSDSVGSAGSLAVRRYARNSEFAYVLVVYNAKNAAQLEISSKVYRNGEVVFAGKPRPVEVLQGSTPPARILTGNVIQLTGLPPDEYILEVVVTDTLRKKEGKKEGVSVRQEIDFRVQ